ncbi:hypothetical protein BH23BAC1_BH23BAC1_22200 [soil metagenome]
MFSLKLIFIFSLILLHSEILCQKNSEWNWGISISPAISRQAPISNKDLLSQEEFPRSRFSYAAGFSFIKKPRNKSTIQLGIGYMHKNNVMVGYYVLPNGAPMETAIFQNKYNDLEIPIFYRLFYGKKKYQFSPSIGGIAGFNLRQVLITSSPSNNHVLVYKFDGFHINRYNFYIGMGNLIKLKKNNSILLEPFFKWDMTAIIGKGRIFDDPNRSFGISPSLFYSLRN